MSDADESPDGDFTFTVAGRRINITHLLDAADNATVGTISFLSNKPEKHGLGVGYVVTAGIVVPVVLGIDPVALAVGILGGAAAARRAFKRASDSGHVQDALSELGYTALGSALAIVSILALAAVALILRRDPAVVAEQFLRFIRFAFQTSTQ